jgi:flagella basal body P-ring formation protein FlgA
MTRALALAVATFVALATPAAAQTAIDRPVLKSDVTVTGDLVRIGDLIDNAGIVADVPIFRAPDLGSTGTVPTSAVIDAVRPHALVGFDTRGLSEVTVTRASRSIPSKQIEDLVADGLSRQYALGEAQDITVIFERELRAIQVEPNAKGEPRLSRINYDPRSGHFDAVVDVPTGTSNRGLLRLSGRAVATVEIVTLARPLDRGALIKSSDVILERHPRTEVGRDAITDSARVIGQAIRNAVQAGRPLRPGDLMKPELVSRGDSVTLVYEVPGITLTVLGKASEGGAQGDTVSVLNEQSKRSVQGVVTGPGRVTVHAATARLASNTVNGGAR